MAPRTGSPLAPKGTPAPNRTALTATPAVTTPAKTANGHQPARSTLFRSTNHWPAIGRTTMAGMPAIPGERRPLALPTASPTPTPTRTEAAEARAQTLPHE
jgi:hypothetical protein